MADKMYALMKDGKVQGYIAEMSEKRVELLQLTHSDISVVLLTPICQIENTHYESNIIKDLQHYEGIEKREWTMYNTYVKTDNFKIGKVKLNIIHNDKLYKELIFVIDNQQDITLPEYRKNRIPNIIRFDKVIVLENDNTKCKPVPTVSVIPSHVRRNIFKYIKNIGYESYGENYGSVCFSDEDNYLSGTFEYVNVQDLSGSRNKGMNIMVYDDTMISRVVKDDCGHKWLQVIEEKSRYGGDCGYVFFYDMELLRVLKGNEEVNILDLSIEEKEKLSKNAKTFVFKETEMEVEKLNSKFLLYNGDDEVGCIDIRHKSIQIRLNGLRVNDSSSRVVDTILNKEGYDDSFAYNLIDVLRGKSREYLLEINVKQHENLFPELYDHYEIDNRLNTDAIVKFTWSDHFLSIHLDIHDGVEYCRFITTIKEVNI